MVLLIHGRDGVRARCLECRKLFTPETGELKAAERLAGRYAFICVPCMARAVAYQRWLAHWHPIRRKEAR